MLLVVADLQGVTQIGLKRGLAHGFSAAMGDIMLSASTLRNLEAFAQQFQNAKPFKHVVIDNFLEESVAERMLAEFPHEADPAKLLNEFGEHNPKKTIADVKGLGGIYADVDSYIQTEPFIHGIEAITGIGELHYDPQYFGAGTHENFHGAGLDPHIDFNFHPLTHEHRRLNAIIYLNKDWDPAWQGSIAFHSNPWDLERDTTVEVQPAFNRCVIFETSEHSWHSVPPIDQPPELRDRSRKSFTIYMYTKDRPKEETAASHTTVYVQRGLPEHIRPGMILTTADYNAIKANIQRRHRYLQQIAKREYRFADTIEQLKTRIAELERNSRVPLVGPAKLGAVHAAMHPDGWVGKKLAFDARLLRDVTTVRLVGRRGNASGPIRISLSAGGRNSTIEAAELVDISLPIEAAADSTLHISIEAPDAAPPPNSPDKRELSFLLDRVELS